MHTPGKSADEVCLLVTTQPIDGVLQEAFSCYESGPDLDDFNRLTVGEAMELLRACEHSGLMHSIWTFKTPFAAAICNCNVESGCMAMRLTAVHDLKIMWRGEWVAQLDAERCTGCARCARLCPFGAITSNRGNVALNASGCWGCGVCRAECTKDAITLVDRRTVPAVAGLW
jgi:Pyruvate/2-oxoacid:ferredoxin oxidoreductase delta subunit